VQRLCHLFSGHAQRSCTGMRSWNIIQYLFCCWHKDQNYGIILPICQCNVNPFFLFFTWQAWNRWKFPAFFGKLLCFFCPERGVGFVSSGLLLDAIKCGSWFLSSQYRDIVGNWIQVSVSQIASRSGIAYHLFCNSKFFLILKRILFSWR